MNGATLLFLAIGLLLTRVQGQGGAATPAPTTVPPLNLTGWTPTCIDTTISFDTGARFTGYYARVVTTVAACTQKDSIDLTKGNVTLLQDCVTQSNKSVVISFEPNGGNVKYAGGKDHTEVRITCSSFGKDGVAAKASVSFTAQSGTASPKPFTAPPPVPTVKMELVEMSGNDISTATPKTIVTLGQGNVYLKISGLDAQQLLLPMKCTGLSHDNKTTYDFFSVGTGANTCAYDDEVLGTFDSTTTTQVSYAHFYPFMFVSGESVTLVCDVLVCTKPLPGGGKCHDTDTRVTGCKPGSVTQTPTTGRRRRSARESEPDTHVLAVTYTVVGSDPDLHGQIATGAGMAVSIPLLAAVASLWIL